MNQVKNGDRRNYMGCLAEKLTNTAMPVDLIREATQTKSNKEGCFVESSHINAGMHPNDMHLTSDLGDVPPEGERRNTIACLEDALR